MILIEIILQINLGFCFNFGCNESFFHIYLGWLNLLGEFGIGEILLNVLNSLREMKPSVTFPKQKLKEQPSDNESNKIEHENIGCEHSLREFLPGKVHRPT